MTQHGDEVALARLGWRVVERRPRITSGSVLRWTVTIANAAGETMTEIAADLGVALGDLVRYARADANMIGCVDDAG